MGHTGPFSREYYYKYFERKFVKKEPQIPLTTEEVKLLNDMDDALSSIKTKYWIYGLAGPLFHSIIHTLVCDLKKPKSGLTYKGKKYVKYTYEEWEETLAMAHSQHTIRSHIQRLEKMGFLQSCQIEPYCRRKWYHLNAQKLKELVIDKDETLIATVESFFARKKKGSKASQKETNV